MTSSDNELLKQLTSNDASTDALLRNAFAQSYDKVLQSGAAEKAIATCLALDLTGLPRDLSIAMGATVTVGSGIVKTLAGIGGSVLIAGALTAAIALYIDQPTLPPAASITMPAIEVPPPPSIVHTYTASSAVIKFVGAKGEFANVNPTGAEITVGDDEGVAQSWQLLASDGKVLAAGDGASATLPADLAAARYTMSFTIAGDNNTSVQVTRDFFVDR